jgi:tetratricopeptide (TPR) repeat protein
MAWLARCKQSDGDLEAAIDIDRQALARAPGVISVSHMMGPLSLYLAGRFSEALVLATDGAAAARASRDSVFIMYSLSHLALNLMGAGRYAEASATVTEARTFGRKYGALPMLARVTAIASGLHMSVFDYEGAESLQAEARELSRSIAFFPSLVSSNIDALLMLARCHEPGRAEQLLRDTARDAAETGGWHQWLWQMRLAEARAELALARGAYADAIAEAEQAIERSRARKRPKYEALGLTTRARALHGLGRTRAAIDDARSSVAVADRLGDPALLLTTLDTMLEIDGSDDLAALARVTVDRIHAALPDDSMRERFRASDVVQRVRGG